MGTEKTLKGGIDGRPLGGTCIKCGKWVPAGQPHACWQPPPPPPPPPIDKEEVEQRQKVYGLNKQGNSHFYNGDYDLAVACYLQASKLDPKNSVIQENLRKAQAWARKMREQRTREEEERRRREAETERKRHYEETQEKIKRIAANLDTLFGRGASGSQALGLDFVGANDPIFAAKEKPASGVDLRFVGVDEPLVVDPRVVRGEMSVEAARKDRNARAQKALNRYVDAVAVNDIGLAVHCLEDALRATPYNRAIQEAYAVALKLRNERARQHLKNRKVTVLLDALQYGKQNWQASLMYLKKRHGVNPTDPFVRDAFYFIAGVSDNIKVTLPDLNQKAPEIDDATHKMMADAVISSMRGNYQEAFDDFSQAHKKYPADRSVRDILNFTEGLLAAQHAHKAGLTIHDEKKSERKK